MPRSSGMADREPCPWRIIDDVGGAFCMGCIGGGIWHMIKGGRMAPKGAKIIGIFSAVQARSPVLGGQFAVWGGVFACCDCTLTYYRQKEDPWNSIASGGITGGVLAARAGPRAVFSAALIGALLLALIEGMGIWFTQMMTPAIPTPDEYQTILQQQQQQGGGGGRIPFDPTAPPTAPPSTSSMSSWFSGGSSTSPATTAPPPMDISSDGTVFQKETTSGGAGNMSSSDTSSTSSSSSSSSWWPFSSKG